MTPSEKLKVLNRFRFISIAEGISFLVLLFIAMPLKYTMDMPLAVTYVGWAHGALFVLYIYIIFPTSKKLQWSYAKTFWGLVVSVLPFGPFLFDRKLKKEYHYLEGQKA
ncbi:DUF3817 domain-containing protein [Litoribacter ruber]|uniref:DUF3817 domain-containing protein n=1 Tax=Litoribacter ruber TaxID=702568 RepID=A0AAP2G371_9BACT|nr:MULTISPECIES: DUF3817 domain-containing protein [Litoribacter]MBS9523160.1 DUF3817 domain-containing protein [Litoribacter alkaliphilus]MBT0810677.1 DUF3817 domain-containing protein [Litoribacter ruber]